MSSSLRHFFNQTGAVVLLTYRAQVTGRCGGGEAKNMLDCVNVEFRVGGFCQGWMNLDLHYFTVFLIP